MSRVSIHRPHRTLGARTAWVFHAGALGDFVLIWPLLRALHAAGRVVNVVASASKAALAAAELGVVQHNAEIPRFTRLWQGPSAIGTDLQAPGVSDVYAFVADEDSEPGRKWFAAARAMFPGARVLAVGPPGSPTRTALWATSGALGPSGQPELLENPEGPVVLHVGAGSSAKRWPMERWLALAESLRLSAVPIDVIAGEVEADEFTSVERRIFASLGGRFLEKLGQLAAMIRAARVFVGADSGPTHLAAQLGAPTVALFGPTDPSIWRPIGPRVDVIAPMAAQEMRWIDVPRVAAVVQKALAAHS